MEYRYVAIENRRQNPSITATTTPSSTNVCDRNRELPSRRGTGGPYARCAISIALEKKS